METNASPALLPPERLASLRQSLQMIEQRELTLPCLLFVTSYRPCAFVLGQLFYMFAPVAAILGLPAWQDWAVLLSEPQGATWLEALLADAVTGPSVSADQGLDPIER